MKKSRLALVLGLLSAPAAFPAPILDTLNYARFYGATDPNVSYACENTNGVACNGSALAAGTNWTVNYFAQSSASFGVLHDQSSVFLTGDSSLGSFPSFESTGARSGYQDTYTIGGGTGTGTIYFTFQVTGTASSANGGFGSDQFQLVPVINGPATSYAVINGSATIPVSFTFNQPITFTIDFYALSQVFTWESGASATADFSHTALLDQIVVRDSQGNVVPDFSIASASGTAYSADGVVPEPSSVILVLSGIALVCGIGTIGSKGKSLLTARVPARALLATGALISASASLCAGPLSQPDLIENLIFSGTATCTDAVCAPFGSGAITGTYSLDVTQQVIVGPWSFSTPLGVLSSSQTGSETAIVDKHGDVAPSFSVATASPGFFEFVQLSFPIANLQEVGSLDTVDTVSNDLCTNNPAEHGCDADYSITGATALALSEQGGPPSNPVFLLGASVEQVSGIIPAPGTPEYYGFVWPGGAFSASASVTGASTNASYLFSEGSLGGCASGGSATLNNADGFSGTISISNLPAGQYCIGLDAPSAPGFTLNFDTPVGGLTTPEPLTWTLLALGLAAMWAYARRSELSRR